jgi:YHS domain-containing protein
MKALLRPLLFAWLGLICASGAFAASPVFTGLLGNTAIKGYDAVAYYTDGKPVPGKPEYVYEWQGARWRFASQAHLDQFKAEPARYAPQYGGYCAYGVGAKNYLVKSDPDAWDIVDGKLYLNYDKDVQKLWKADRAAYIQKADANWPALVK